MKRTRILALVIAFVMIAAMLAACGNNNDPVTPATTRPPATVPPVVTAPPILSDVPDYMNDIGVYPIAKEMTDVTVFMQRDIADSPWEDLSQMKWYEELTNIRLVADVEHDAEDFRTRLSLMLVSQTYPEVIMARGNLRWWEDEEYGRDGFFIDTTPLVARWMPMAMEAMAAYPFMRVGQTASDGAMYGFPFTYSGVGGNPHNWYMDMYWMLAAGYNDVPNTTDEMRKFMYDIHEVITTGITASGEPIVEHDPENFPIMYTIGGRSPQGHTPWLNVMLAGYTGTLISMTDIWAAPDNKTVQPMIDHPGYREAFRFFRDLYRDGLMDPELWTMDAATANSRKQNGQYAMYISSSTLLLNSPDLIRMPRPVDDAEGWVCQSIRPLTSQWNDKRRVGFENLATINSSSITDKMEKPELYARWLDPFYNIHKMASRENAMDNDMIGAINFHLGVYGEHWEIFDQAGSEFWRFLPARSDGATDANGNPARINWDYFRQNIGPGWNMPGGVNPTPWMDLGNPIFVRKQMETIRNQYPYCTTDTQLPMSLLRMTEAEQDRTRIPRNEITSYIEQSYAEFVTGQLNVDDDAVWKAFIDRIYSLGANEVTAALQGSYDRWNQAMGN